MHKEDNRNKNVGHSKGKKIEKIKHFFQSASLILQKFLVKVFDENQQDEKKKRWLDVLLIFVAMAIGVGIRLPALFMPMVPENERSEFLTEENEPYLYEMDSYYFAQKTKCLVEHCEIVDKRDMLLPIIGAFLYWIANIFINVSVEQIVIFSGPVVFALSCIPIYLFVKRKTNRFGGFFAGVLINITPSLLASTNFCMFDTDILLTVLPASLFLSLISMFDNNQWKKKIFYSILSLVFFIMLIFAWHSASVYFYLLLFFFVAILVWRLCECKFGINELCKNKENILCIVLALCFIGSYLVLNQLDFVGSNVKKVVSASTRVGGYPDSSLFISEFQKVPLLSNKYIGAAFNVNAYGSINRLGGIAFFTLAVIVFLVILFGLFVCFRNVCLCKNGRAGKFYKVFKNYIPLCILLIIWFLGGFYALSKGIRMVKIMAIPTILLAGFGFGWLYNVIVKSERILKIFYLLFAISLILPSFGSVANAWDFVPGTNDSASEIIDYIIGNIGEDYTIATWCDLGYFYEYKGLNVIFDGGTHNYVYWVGNALLTENSELAAGIFRMLIGEDGVGTMDGPDKAQEMFDGDLAMSSDFLKEILVLNRDEAEERMKDDYDFSDEDIEELLNYTHPEAGRRIAFVITEDMLAKIEAISYYGLYDIKAGEKKEEIQDYSDSIINRLYNNDTDVDGVFEFRTRIEDPTNTYSSVIWTIKD